MSQFIVEDNKIVVYDELANTIIDNVSWGYDPELEELFLNEFEVIHGTHPATKSFGKYQAVMSVIKRKSDGKLFGFEYDYGPFGGENHIESNGEFYGYGFEPPADFDWENDHFPLAYVWLPIEPFTIIGYKVTK